MLLTYVPGIFPHDGKNIRFKDITPTVRKAYNIGPSIAYYVPSYSAHMLKKSYSKDTFDLSELNMTGPSAIEHNASFSRTLTVSL